MDPAGKSRSPIDKNLRPAKFCLNARLRPGDESYKVPAPLQFAPKRRHGVQVTAERGANQTKVWHRSVFPLNRSGS